MLGGEGPLSLSLQDNFARKADGSAMEMVGRFGDSAPELLLNVHDEIFPEPVHRGHVERVLETCGARPDMRDPIDARIVADVRNGTGRIIDSEQEVGGYPVRPETRAAFVESEWDLERMERRA
jgi:hypothetical protein